jgi:cytochrome c peroxidase
MKFNFIILIACVSICLASGRKSISNNEKKLAQLGKLLFFDTDLSINKSKSCASCHNPQLFFTDGYRRAIGTFGDVMARNTPSLINSAYLKSFNWADPNIKSYQAQMQTPLFSQTHIEMGLQAHNEKDAVRILSKKEYEAFVKKETKEWELIMNALAAYQKTLISRNSKYDKYLRKKAKLTAQEQAGAELFFSEKLKCGKCHGGIDFNTPELADLRFANTGLYEQNEILYSDSGLANFTHRAEDVAQYRIPSLRNVAATAPYYHDGSGANLNEVIQNYAQGGRNAKNSKKHPLIQGFQISEQEQLNLILFLNTLTDSSVLKKFAHQG